MKKNNRVTVQMIAHTRGISVDLIEIIMKDRLNLIKIASRWMSKLLHAEYALQFLNKMFTDF